MNEEIRNNPYEEITNSINYLDKLIHNINDIITIKDNVQLKIPG